MEAGIGMTLRTAKYRPAAYVRKLPPTSQKSRSSCGQHSVPGKARSGKSVNVEGAASRQRGRAWPPGRVSCPLNSPHAPGAKAVLLHEPVLQREGGGAGAVAGADLVV